MPKYLVFCFPDDSHNPCYENPAEVLSECGLTQRWRYADTVDASLPYQVYAGIVEGETASAVRDAIFGKLAAAFSDRRGVDNIDRFHLFVSGPEISTGLVLR